MSAQEKDGIVNKALAAAIITLLSWNIHTTYKLSVELAVISEKVERIEEIIKGSN